ncbi:putative phosphoribosyl transferase [Rhodovulum imhoffii]|uniref:Putative phosphoribosyl transferase n=1 Tax=Rhodovulum imhoffii TaxID=365340 RepID=A0A2T5BUB7_9RHOB|nr:phosphoribosyltransferase family protein [Rhodovulum imhoffii]MBK5934572.1 hypothetical protein [Rhodovulum imhoffii]PTN03011.1 putative phosphoribosyl transferase [Rhodovulum imhoffii]
MLTDRTGAGRELAEKLAKEPVDAPVILALARGGVPVALPIARALNAPLDLAFVRKLPMPGQPELAAGAVVESGAREVVFNTGLLAEAGLEQAYFTRAVAAAGAEIARQRAAILGDRVPLHLSGRTVIVVDDGIATGASIRAVLQAVRRRGPVEVWLAVPVAPQEMLWQLRGWVDRLVFLEAPRTFHAISQHYACFAQISDREVRTLMVPGG